MLKSAVSDLEVDYEVFEQPGKLHVPSHGRAYEFGVLMEFAYKARIEHAPRCTVTHTHTHTQASKRMRPRQRLSCAHTRTRTVLVTGPA